MNLFNTLELDFSPTLKKILSIMKLTVVFLIVFSLNISATVYSQTTKLSLNVQNQSIKEVLYLIENQSDFRFIYESGKIDLDKKISVYVKNQTVESVLERIFKTERVEYEITDSNFILINPIEKVDDTIVVQYRKQVMGIVKDEKGEPLIGVNVVENGTMNGTVTDIEGKFSLEVAPNSSLLFSYIGYLTQEVAVGSKINIIVNLVEDSQNLEEVVVVGYGVQKKVNLTGAIATVSSKDIENRPVTNVSSSLAGMGANVYVRQTSAQPGSDGASIRVRGVGTLSNSYQAPIVLVDGIESSMDMVNPNDIESISILKDAASSAIYGSRAANGVILITTKKGKSGQMRLNYSGNFSIAEPSNLHRMVSNYPRRMRLMNEGYTNLGNQPFFSDNYIDEWEKATLNPDAISEKYGILNKLAYPNTDWSDVIFENNIVQNHNLSASGGSEKVHYLTSFGFLNNPGIMSNTGLKQYQFRINVEGKITNFLKIGTQTFASLQNLEGGDTKKVFEFYKRTTPAFVPYYDGRYGGTQTPDEVGNNLLYDLHQGQGSVQKKRFNTTWYGILEPIKGLSIEGRFNYQNYQTNTHSFNQSLDLWDFANETIALTKTLLSERTNTYSRSDSYQYTAEVLGRFNTVIAKQHEINALIGFQQYYYDVATQSATKRGLLSENLTTLNSTSEMVSISGDESDLATRSLFGRLNYVYNNKYLFEANFRYDGSSKFAKESRWGFFPSFSGGWRMTEEPFMSSIKDIFQNIKLRASWGKLGNVTSGYYSYQATYGLVNYPFGGNISTGLRQGTIANKNLHWEHVNSTDIGLDLATLNNRLLIEFDWYHRLTDGILTTPPIYLTMGLVGAPTKNTASVLNRGVEFSVKWSDKIGNVNYSVYGNLSYNHNEVTKYKGKFDAGWKESPDGKNSYFTNIGDVSSNSGSEYTLEGHPIGEYYLLNRYRGDQSYKNADGSVNIKGGPKDGMIRTQEDLEWVKSMIAAGYKFNPVTTVGKAQLYYGDFIYDDSNEDGTYGNSNDRLFTGKSSTPKYIYGFGLNVDWKGFDFSMHWAGAAGMYYFWNENYTNNSLVGARESMPLHVMNDHYYYNEDNPNDLANNIHGKYPRLKSTDTQNNVAQDFWLYNASYLKLKNVQIGYNFPQKWINKVYIQNLRLYVTGENLLTITPYPGLDPEIGSSVSYPTMRQYAFGLNITF